jgi:capsular exopolysaccharide synthesis family protein
LACHLATSLARAGRKTLLIDGDLRRPSIHRLFNLERGLGLCEFLRGEAQVADIVQPTPVADLNLITAGRCDALAVQILAGKNLHALLSTLKEDYDFIIVDSAPVLPVADSLLIGQSVEGVVFSVLRDVSRLPDVQTARERLSVLGVETVGVVVSGVPGEGYSSSEYYSDGAD